MNVERTESGSGTRRGAAALGAVAGVFSCLAPLALLLAGRSWLVQTFGAAAPANALVTGVAGAVLSGATVFAVLAVLRASPPVFFGVWVGTTLVRLMGMAVLAIAPLGGDGATAGALVGYTAAIVLGSLIEIPAVWIGGSRLVVPGRPGLRA